MKLIKPVSQITILRNRFHPREREVQNILSEVSSEIPTGYKFGIATVGEENIILKGFSSYEDIVIKALKNNGLDFVANIFKPQAGHGLQKTAVNTNKSLAHDVKYRELYELI